jgi:hypothetical protein
MKIKINLFHILLIILFNFINSTPPKNKIKVDKGEPSKWALYIKKYRQNKKDYKEKIKNESKVIIKEIYPSPSIQDKLIKYYSEKDPLFGDAHKLINKQKEMRKRKSEDKNEAESSNIKRISIFELLDVELWVFKILLKLNLIK